MLSRDRGQDSCHMFEFHQRGLREAEMTDRELSFVPDIQGTLLNR
jgi:hypothetical protein